MLINKGVSIKQYEAKFYRDTSHAYEVKKLCLMLFDEIHEKLDDLPLKSRKLLEAAALLHDIGYNIDSKNHNKHSFSLIIENGIENFDERQLQIIALVARYHRGSLPNKSRHAEYAELSKKDRKIVKKLSAILRICDGLDRAHMQLIKELTTNFDIHNKIFQITLTSNIPQRIPDITSAIKKKDLFEKIFDVQVVFKFTQT